MDWPKELLRLAVVVEVFASDNDDELDQFVIVPLSTQFVNIHKSMEHENVSQKLFPHFISNYK